MEVGEGLLLSHVGDVNAMGSDQTAEALKRLDGDPALTFATIRVLAGVGAAFAMATAERSVERGTAQFDEEVARLLRGTVRELTFTANEP